MKRRRYLLGLVGAVGAMAGCLGGGSDAGSDPASTPTDGGGGSGESTSKTTADDSVTPTANGSEGGRSGPNVGNVELPVSKDELVRGAPKNAIPAITDPAFGTDWSDVQYSLADGDRVIGVKRDGQARAYPIKVLDYHEVVNDEFAGPLLVTFCPLCGSGMTAVRKAGGQVTTFGVSGYLFRSDLVMFDEATQSLWSQIMATAINGELTGETLTLVPSSLTTWGAWRSDNPESTVMLPPPKSGTIVDARPRPYNREPYAGYGETDQVGIGYNDFEDDRLHPKAQVIGVQSGGEAVAYPYDAVVDEGVVNDTVGDLPVVVTTGPAETLYAYVRTVDGETQTFESAGKNRLAAGGSEWAITTGEAVSGPHEGTRLEQANEASTMFWFAWVDFHPDTAVYGQG